MSNENKVLPVGVLMNIDGDYYIVPFTAGADAMTIPQGSGLRIEMKDLEVSPWLGPTMPGIMPLSELKRLDNPLRPIEPTPPEFGSPEDAEKWLEDHPYAVLDRAVGDA